MASRLLGRQSRIVAYLPNLRSVVRHFRAFSSYDERHPRDTYTEVVTREDQSDLPDPHLSPFEPQDARFPLPGMTGVSVTPQQSLPPQSLHHVPDLLSQQQPHERHFSVLQQFAAKVHEEAELEESNYLTGDKPAATDLLECLAQDCPELLRKDFQDLFPARDLSSGPLTVITISQKTTNDMSTWSPDVEMEREELLQHFISSAEEICTALQQAGYWADFIDPSSGRPYLGEYTNATFFETDERYRHFGFTINDLGCCKVISHHLWGSFSYIGSLFTNAPCDHPILQAMNSQEHSIEAC